MSRFKQRLRKAALITGFILLGLSLIRLCFWHVENDIREAAFRHAFTHCYHQQSRCHVNFISVCYGCTKLDNIRVPVFVTPFLLNRFKNSKIPVKLEDQSTYSDFHNQIADTQSGKTGVIFYTGAIWWVSSDTVKIEVGYYEGTLSGSGNIYTLKRKNGRWVVVKDEMLWIS